MHVLEHVVHFAAIAASTEAVRRTAVDDHLSSGRGGTRAKGQSCDTAERLGCATMCSAHLSSQHEIVHAVEQQLDAIIGSVQRAVDVAGAAVPEQASETMQ